MGKDDWKKAFKEAFDEAEAAEKKAKAAKDDANVAKAAAAKQQVDSAKTIAEANQELGALKPNAKKAIKAATGKRDDAQAALDQARKDEGTHGVAATQAEEQQAEAAQTKARTVLAARTDYGRARRRLVELVKKIPAGADTTEMDRLYKVLEAEYQADEFSADKLYEKLEKVEEEVEKLTASKVAQPLYDEIVKRLEAYPLKHPLYDSREMVKLRADLKSAATKLEKKDFQPAIKQLRGEIEFALDSFEADANDLTVVRKELEDELKELKKNAFRDDKLVVAIEAGVKTAMQQTKSGSVADGSVALGDLTAKLEAAKQWADENKQAESDYAAERLVVKKAADDFDVANPGYKAECRNKVRLPSLDSAVMFASQAEGKTDFVTALRLLGEAASTLIGLEAKVAAKKQQLSDADQNKAEAAAAAKAQAKAIADKKAKEEADCKALVAGSLAKIGKAKMHTWLAQLGRLLHEAPKPPVKLVVGSVTALKKFEGAIFTVEVACTVQTAESLPLDTFVVHYHPTLTKKEVEKSDASSRFHGKRGRSVKPIFKLDEDSHWLIAQKHVPHINAVPDS